MSNDTTFIYALLCPDSGEVRYVGKANNPQLRLRDHLYGHANKNSHKSRWIKLLREQGKFPTLVILEEVPISEWIEAEKKWIEYYRSNSAKLTNITDGGQGGFSRRGMTFSSSHTSPKCHMTMRLPDELMEWLEAQAKIHNCSINKYVESVLERLKKESEK